VLIATSDLEAVQRVETMMVDGILVDIKIVEEGSNALGEDACLYEEESLTEVSQSDDEAGYDDPEVRRNVNFLVDNMVGEMEEENQQPHKKYDNPMFEAGPDV
ncbi:DUF4283 domain protein, partial [Trifolium medium]|nr:DUF4283 domain protein [Trifolium medium]